MLFSQETHKVENKKQLSPSEALQSIYNLVNGHRAFGLSREGWKTLDEHFKIVSEALPKEDKKDGV